MMRPWLSINSRQQVGLETRILGPVRVRVCLCGWQAGKGRCEGGEPDRKSIYPLRSNRWKYQSQEAGGVKG